jgi:hypothetical protein
LGAHPARINPARRNNEKIVVFIGNQFLDFELQQKQKKLSYNSRKQIGIRR